jgi:hypothetical protein
LSRKRKVRQPDRQTLAQRVLMKMTENGLASSDNECGENKRVQSWTVPMLGKRIQ